MVAYNFTIDETSPTIQYSGNWSVVHDEDTRTKDYFFSTFASTTTAGDSATLRFNGTGIWAFGAKRFNHGRYTATLDGQLNTYSGFAAEPGEIQAVLFKQTGLDAGKEHTLTLSNADQNWWLDVDYFIVQNEVVDNHNELSIVTSVQDIPDPDFYKIRGDWNKAYSGKEYHNQTGLVSYEAGDAVTFSFTGSSVAVYGGIAVTHGVYSVICDGVSQDYNGYYAGRLTGGAVLFHKANLEDTTHTVTFINQAAKPTNIFGIDYVQWNATRRGNAKPCVTCASTTSQSDSKAPTTTGKEGSSSSAVSISTTSIDLISLSTASMSPALPIDSNLLQTPTRDASPVPSSFDANTGSTPVEHAGINLNAGAWAGIALGGVALIICVALIIWRCTKKRSKKDSLYYWQESSAISLASTENDKSSPLTCNACPEARYQDSPQSSLRINTNWPVNSSSGALDQVEHARDREESFTLPESAPLPPLTGFEYYPYAQSITPPTNAGSLVLRGHGPHRNTNSQSKASRSQALLYAAPSSSALPSALGPSIPKYSDFASAAVSSSLDALIRDYAAPSFSALPSSAGDSAGSPAANPLQGRSPDLLNTSNLQQSPRLQRNNSAVSTPSSIATTGSRAGKQLGESLPATATMPTSTLSEETLQRMRMTVDGRPQDFGPITSSDDSRSIGGVSQRTLPPAYTQAIEPLPEQPTVAFPRRQEQI